MRKFMLCMMLGVAAGCAEQSGSAPSASAPSSADVANAVALVKFTCPTMH